MARLGAVQILQLFPDLDALQIGGMANHYDQWAANFDAQLAVEETWYEATELMRTINLVSRKNFSVVEQRAAALQELDNMATDAPFDAQRRFPEHGKYVREISGDWMRKFAQLRAALGTKDRHQEKSEGAAGSATGMAGGREMSTRSAEADALVAFSNVCMQIKFQLKDRQNLYGREKFEQDFNLNWV